MIYAVSDLHGCFGMFMRLMEMIHLKDEDALYVLGDMVDRGSENMKLISELAGKKNIFTLMGNHDYLAALMMKTYGMGREGKRDLLCGKAGMKELFEAWLSDGGEMTWNEFMRLDPAEKEVIRRFLESRPVFAEIRVNGQTFHLSHTVPEAERMRDPGRSVLTDFLFSFPEYDKVYFPDRILITGHTPTGLIEETSAGRIWKKNNHIAIDCGAVFGGKLGCICLDTGEEFYAE